MCVCVCVCVCVCARSTISSNKYVRRNVKISAIFTESTRFAVSKPTANERYMEKEIRIGQKVGKIMWLTRRQHAGSRSCIWTCINLLEKIPNCGRDRESGKRSTAKEGRKEGRIGEALHIFGRISSKVITV